MKRSAIMTLVFLLLAVAPAPADNPTQTFAGTLKWINLDKTPKQFGVTGAHGSSSSVHTFYIDSDFQGVYGSMNGAKKKLSDLHSGMQVQVTFHKAHVFGSDRATRVTIVNGFAIPMAMPSTKP